MTMIAKTARMFMIAGTLATTVAGAVPASANDADVIQRGSCSGRSDWKLKLSPENGRIEVEFEVDSNVNGQTWHVRILQNGSRIFSGNRVTQAPSGSFEVRKLANNTVGTDRFRARAVNAANGETCVGSAAI
jgi:hypothetical protein